MENSSSELADQVITIFYFRISKNMDETSIQNLISTLSLNVQSKLASFQNKMTRNQSLFGHIMLNYIKTGFGFPDSELSYEHTSGKPYFTTTPKIGFNVSHSGHLVVCCFTKNADLGIDLEQKGKHSIKNFRYCFNSEEWQYIMNSENPEKAFLHLWVRKEAIIKADGRGMEIELSSFSGLESEVNIGLNTWCLQDITIDPDYFCAIACSKKKEVKLVDFNSILNLKNNFYDISR